MPRNEAGIVLPIMTERTALGECLLLIPFLPGSRKSIRDSSIDPYDRHNPTSLWRPQTIGQNMQITTPHPIVEWFIARSM
jgi:hypothetical protein